MREIQPVDEIAPAWPPVTGSEGRPGEVPGGEPVPDLGRPDWTPPPSRLELRLQEVKTACDGAYPTGTTSAALRYYRSALRAQDAGDETECFRRLEAAEKTLR